MRQLNPKPVKILTAIPTRLISHERINIMTDEQARSALKNIIIKHASHSDPETEDLLSTVDDTSRQTPIRGALEHIKNTEYYTQQELALIDELLYLYG
ncbi:hypothetical protein [Pseudomonas chlororaphis]|uniref:hypothetical protein n=1 Tax=Pseudomonas chlororaphis TaxID=587753 RepID=UPI001F14D175|nr:hypothetical protein [Pseudomonas chlororaphis]